jgi:hypothetical protein
MPGSAYPIVSGILMLTVITIAYGRTFILSVITLGILIAAVLMPTGS